MCGRFAVFDIHQSLPIGVSLESAERNYNVAPSQEILAVVWEDHEARIQKFHWGLVPFWAKDKSIGNRLINARIETVAEKPAFRVAFKKRRCLIPANGFYEWVGGDGQKQPYFITLPSSQAFAFAGLWETWDKEDPPYRSCLIITTEASESIKPIHNRMPVILKPDFQSVWLDPDTPEPLKVLQTGMEMEFVYHPVSRKVNRPGQSSPDLIERMNSNSH